MRHAPVSARLRRITLGGEALAGFALTEPAASVRLLLPRPGAGALVLPAWNGNEFLDADGTRPTIRTLTPRAFDADANDLAVDVVLHDGGAVSSWAAAALSGAPVAISGPGRGFAIPDAKAFVLAGDDTAIPAISQLLEHLPPERTVQVEIETAHQDARHALPHHPGASVTWQVTAAGAPPGDALLAAVRAAPMHGDTHVWAAGEAAAMQRLRRHLFDERGLARVRTTVRGYWKSGRAAGGDDA